jgi:site-specific DNA recombinase
MSKALAQNKQPPKAQGQYDDRVGLVYARVSSKKQELEGHGRESQEGRCKSDLASIGVRCEKSFLDTYTGGGDFMQRPAMREMLAYIDANPHKKFVVIFDDLKRFARDTVFHLKLRSALKARDVLPRCLNYKFDDSPEGMFVETVLAAGNELERHQNKRQVIQKMKARLDAGYWPFAAKRGYEMTKSPMHGKLLVPNSDAPLLKEAAEGFAYGKFPRKIDACKFLVGRGFWAKQAPEKYIDKLTEIFSSPVICGDIEYAPWGVARRPGHHEGIISRDCFDILQRRLKNDGARACIRIDLRDDFPLRGLVLCAECGNPMTGGNTTKKRTGKKTPYYYCQRKGCPLYGKMCRWEDVEKDFRTLLKRNHLKGQVEKVVDVVFDRVWNQEVNNLQWQEQFTEHRNNELENKIKQLAELVRKAKSEVVQRAYERQIEESEKELEEMTQPRISELDTTIPYRTALGKVHGVLKNPVSIWDSVDVHEKHRLFFFLFEAKLAYTRNEGYRTGDSLSSTRLFEEFAGQNPLDVDLGGIEPPPPQCECGVLPLNYRPGVRRIYYMRSQDNLKRLRRERDEQAERDEHKEQHRRDGDQRLPFVGIARVEYHDAIV